MAAGPKLQDAHATLAAIETLLHPASIAVVGATERAGYGARLLNNLIKTSFGGRIYPVNPNRTTVFELPCYPSLLDLPETPDLTAVIVPAQQALEPLRQSAQIGARAAIVISAGFAELGSEAGFERHAELQALVAETGLRVLGPNCLGAANVSQNVWATASTRIEANQIVDAAGAALVSQSGATGFGPLLATARDRGLGFRYIVTTGNESDLRATDFAEYFLLRPEIRVVTMLVEAVRDFQRLKALAELARRGDKRLVMLKVGRSEAGQRAARSHTAALTGSDRTQDALFRQFGIVRVRDYDELVEQTALFMKASLPAGRRIGVVSHSGGIAAHLSDLLGAEGLDVPLFSEATRRGVADILGERGSAQNPADITTFANSPSFGPILSLLLADPGLDAWLVATQGSEELVGKIIAAAEETSKPLAVAWTGSQAAAAGLPLLRASAVPVFAFPGGAARGMAALVKLAETRRGQAAATEQNETKPVGEVRVEARGPLSEHQSKRLLSAVGIASPPEVLCQQSSEALKAASEFGYPVVLKACSPDLSHKSDHGLVRLDLRSADELRGTFEEILAAVQRLGVARFEGVLVQPYLRGGVETIVGLSNDPQLGLLVMLGLGGTLVEAMGAVTWRACPISSFDAEAMVDELPALSALLQGVRGAPPADRAALVQTLVQLSSLGSRLGDRLETLDVNPLLVRAAGQGVLALDALAVLRSDRAP